MKKFLFAIIAIICSAFYAQGQSAGIPVTLSTGVKVIIPIKGIELIDKGITSGIDVELGNVRTHYIDNFDSLILRSGGNLIEMDSMTKRTLIPVVRITKVTPRASGRATVIAVVPTKTYISKLPFAQIAPLLTGFTASNVDAGPDTILATDTTFYLQFWAIAGERYNLNYTYTTTVDTMSMVTEGANVYVSGLIVSKTTTPVALNSATAADYASPGNISVGQIETGDLILETSETGLLKIGIGSLGAVGSAIVARSKWYIRKIE